MAGISGLLSPAQWLIDAFNGVTSKSKPVTADEALSTAPLWYGVNKISGHVGMLPMSVHRRTDAGSEKDLMHAGSRLMRIRPNAYQIPIVFRELIQVHALLWGNGRAYIRRDAQGRPVELIPLMPDRTHTFPYDGEKVHVTRPRQDERILNFQEANAHECIGFMDNEVLHIPGLGFDGFRGKRLMDVARESLTVSVEGDRRSANQMQNGFSAQLMLEAPTGLFRNENDATEFLKTFRESHEADKDAQTVGLLREGMKANVLNMSNRDAEFLQSRQFQREEIALWLGIETMPGTGNDSFNSLEQRGLAYLSDCLQKWLTKWEQECDAKLLTPQEQLSGSHYFRFNTGALLRTDLSTTITSFGNAISSRIMNPNEAREKLDMNAYEGGEVFENPYTTSGGTGTNQSAERDYEASNKAKRAITAHLEHLLKIEEDRVNSKLDRNEDRSAVVEWYAKWEKTLGDAIENIGGDRALAAEHCQTNLKFIENAKQLNLKGSAELLAERILEQ